MAATVLARGLAAPHDKAMAVRALLQQHRRVVANGRPRPLSLIADATDVAYFEAATPGRAHRSSVLAPCPPGARRARVSRPSGVSGVVHGRRAVLARPIRPRGRSHP